MSSIKLFNECAETENIIQAIIDGILDECEMILTEKRISEQVLPSTLNWMKDSLLGLIDDCYLKCDDLNVSYQQPDNPLGIWTTDTEPIPIPLDSWATGIWQPIHSDLFVSKKDKGSSVLMNGKISRDISRAQTPRLSSNSVAESIQIDVPNMPQKPTTAKSKPTTAKSPSQKKSIKTPLGLPTAKSSKKVRAVSSTSPSKPRLPSLTLKTGKNLTSG
jgi:hypothetical protein